MRKRIIIDMEDDRKAQALINILLTSGWDFRVQNLHPEVRPPAVKPNPPAAHAAPPPAPPPPPPQPPVQAALKSAPKPTSRVVPPSGAGALSTAIYGSTHRQWMTDFMQKRDGEWSIRGDIMKSWLASGRPEGSLSKTLQELTESGVLECKRDATPMEYRLNRKASTAKPSEPEPALPPSPPEPSEPAPSDPAVLEAFVAAPEPSPAKKRTPFEQVGDALASGILLSAKEAILMGRQEGDEFSTVEIAPLAAVLGTTKSSISVALTGLKRDRFIEALGGFRSGRYRIKRTGFPRPVRHPKRTNKEGKTSEQVVAEKAESFHGAPFDKIELEAGLRHTGFSLTTLQDKVREMISLGRLEPVGNGKYRMVPPKASMLRVATRHDIVDFPEGLVIEPDVKPDPAIRTIILQDLAVFEGRDFKVSDVRALAPKHDIKEGPLYVTFRKMVIDHEVLDHGQGYYAIPI